MFDSVTIDEIVEMADSVGRSVAREYPGLDAEDLSSEAIACVLENKALLNKDAAYLAKALEAYATKHALAERYEYMMRSSEYIYRPSEVRALLKEVYWSPDLWEVPSGKDDYLSATVSADTVFVSVLDIQTVWSGLRATYRDVLTRVFRDGQEPVHSQEVTRAIDALTRALNWRVNRSQDHEGPGSRTAKSNAQGQFLAKQGTEREGRFERDALDEVQKIRSAQKAKPVGTHFDWGNK